MNLQWRRQILSQGFLFPVSDRIFAIEAGDLLDSSQADIRNPLRCLLDSVKISTTNS